jgi:hypothetical protein
MRFTLRIMSLTLVLLALLVPLAAHASCGPCPHGSCAPCPDDPVLSQTCDPTKPDFYVVANRAFDRLGPQYGTGCQPWILKNPDCKGWASTNAECTAAQADVTSRICGPMGELQGDPASLPTSPNDTATLYEMYCDDGNWIYYERALTANCAAGTCYWDCGRPTGPHDYLPPRTGIDLPAPVIVGGLAAIGVGLLTAGVLVRRRTLRVV